MDGNPIQAIKISEVNKHPHTKTHIHTQTHTHKKKKETHTHTCTHTHTHTKTHSRADWGTAFLPLSRGLVDRAQVNEWTALPFFSGNTQILGAKFVIMSLS